MTSRCGFERASGMYYEILGERRSQTPPWLFIHGGSGTGAIFRVTPDGRPGWAEALAADGHECWLVDWPGMGRSAGVDQLAVDFEAVIEACVRLIDEVIGEPVIVLGHSMGGAIAWKVAELARPLVAGVVGIAPAHPGNVGPPPDVVSDDGETVVVRHFGSKVAVRLDRLFVPAEEFVTTQWIEPSTRFPIEHADVFRHTVVPMPPKIPLQRLGLGGGIPSVADTSRYEGLWVRVVAGTQDLTHPREEKQAIVDLMRSWGADAELVYLGDRGIVGNGHFMFSELNSDEILQVVVDEVAALSGSEQSQPT